MPQITVTVRNKIAEGDKSIIICGNTDYLINFDFDDEWDETVVKTLRVNFAGKYRENVFTGNTAILPAVENTLYCSIGVYAGNLETTTPAKFICKKSILCGSEKHVDPPIDVYNQILEMIEAGAIKGPKGDPGEDYILTEADKEEIARLSGVTPEKIASAVEAYLDEHPVQPGATPEEHNQIYQNKENIELLQVEVENASELLHAI